MRLAATIISIAAVGCAAPDATGIFCETTDGSRISLLEDGASVFIDDVEYDTKDCTSTDRCLEGFDIFLNDSKKDRYSTVVEWSGRSYTFIATRDVSNDFKISIDNRDQQSGNIVREYRPC